MLLEILFRWLFAECRESWKMRGQHSSQLEIMWDWTRSGAWCLGMKPMHLRHLGERWQEALKGWGIRERRQRAMEGDLDLGRL